MRRNGNSSPLTLNLIFRGLRFRSRFDAGPAFLSSAAFFLRFAFLFHLSLSLGKRIRIPGHECSCFSYVIRRRLVIEVTSTTADSHNCIRVFNQRRLTLPTASIFSLCDVVGDAVVPRPRTLTAALNGAFVCDSVDSNCVASETAADASA